MEIVYERVAAIDVGKKIIAVAVRTPRSFQDRQGGWVSAQRVGLIIGGWPGDLWRVAAGEATELR